MTHEMRLFNDDGKRLYLTAEERQAFYNAAKDAPPPVRTICHTLFYTGCRVQEALNLTYEHVDLSAQHLVFRTLKKRSKIQHRAVPVPESFLDALNLVHDIKGVEKARKNASLWTWNRQSVWRLVKDVILAAGIDGTLPHATAKGLRHAFGIHATLSGVPLNEVQKLMGHADIKTTAIYLDAVGEEKRGLVSRMW